MVTGQEIKAFRKKTGMTQEQFAKYTGVSRESVIRYERGVKEPPIRVTSLIERRAVNKEYLYLSNDWEKNLIKDFLTWPPHQKTNFIEHLKQEIASKIHLLEQLEEKPKKQTK